MKKYFLFIIIISLNSCGHLKLPQTHYFYNNHTYEQTYDIVWGKIIRWLSDNNISIKTIDKTSGYITTEKQYQNYSYELSDCDCGETGTTVVMKNFVSNMNLIVEKISENSTKITIQVVGHAKKNISNLYIPNEIDINDIECYSFGKLELKLLDYLQQ